MIPVPCNLNGSCHRAMKKKHSAWRSTILCCSIACFAIRATGQQSQQPSNPDKKQSGGATGAAHPAIKDCLSRPITAGGLVGLGQAPGSANARWGSRVPLAACANDRCADIHVPNYGKSRLYPTTPNGTFTAAPARAGVALGGWSTSPTWGDYDHDGRLDLFVPG